MHCVSILGDPHDDELAPVYGAMLPLTGPLNALGVNYKKSLTAARNEYLNAYGSLSTAPHPPVYVLCDENKDPEAVADHLINKVGVKEILGPTWPAAVNKVLPMSVPKGVITMLPVSNDPTVEEATGTNGQLWSCKPNISWTLKYWKALTGEVEAYVKMKTGANTLRVGLMAAGDAASQALADRSADLTFFNGKDLTTNTGDGNFKRLNYEDSRVELVPYSVRASNMVTNFLSDANAGPPNLMIVISSNDGAAKMLPQLEKAWANAKVTPPHYLFVGNSEQIQEGVLLSPEQKLLTTRILAVSPLRDDRSVKLFNAFGVSLGSSDGETVRTDSEYFYDCFWAQLYATYAATAADKLPLSALKGTDFAAKGITGITDTSLSPTNVGPNDAKNAVSYLSNGATINLHGASSALDFDLVKANPPADGLVQCVTVVSTAYKLVPSGATFSAQTGEKNGSIACP